MQERNPEAKNLSASAQQDFVISRIFDAPREKVWRAWTDREELMKWFGPKGSSIPHAKLDLRPGGIFHYAMRTQDGHELWGKWVFREIIAPVKLVVISSFSDAQGGITRHPMSANWCDFNRSTQHSRICVSRRSVTYETENSDSLY